MQRLCLRAAAKSASENIASEKRAAEILPGEYYFKLVFWIEKPSGH